MADQLIFVVTCADEKPDRDISAEDLLEGIEIVSGPTLVGAYPDAKNVVIY